MATPSVTNGYWCSSNGLTRRAYGYFGISEVTVLPEQVEWPCMVLMEKGASGDTWKPINHDSGNRLLFAIHTKTIPACELGDWVIMSPASECVILKGRFSL